jgi:hypothetical protein
VLAHQGAAPQLGQLQVGEHQLQHPAGQPPPGPRGPRARARATAATTSAARGCPSPRARRRHHLTRRPEGRRLRRLPPSLRGRPSLASRPEQLAHRPFQCQPPAPPPLPPLPGGVRCTPRLTKGRRTGCTDEPSPSPAAQRGRQSRPTRLASPRRARGSAIRVEGTKQGRTPSLLRFLSAPDVTFRPRRLAPCS